MNATFDELAVAHAAIEDAEAALRQAVRYAKQVLGTDEEERAMKVVHKCQTERDRANARLVALQQCRSKVLTP